MLSQTRALTSEPDAERSLITRAIANERSAQDRIFNEYAPAIYRLAFRMAGDGDLASDMTQETFIKAFDRLSTFRHDSTLRTWIHSIAVSVILGTLRTIKRREANHSSIVVDADMAQTKEPSDSVLKSRLYSAIDALPPGYRTVFVMHEIEGYSHPEIAQHLGVEITTSQGQLFRARAKLRELLKDFAGEIKS